MMVNGVKIIRFVSFPSGLSLSKSESEHDTNIMGIKILLICVITYMSHSMIIQLFFFLALLQSLFSDELSEPTLSIHPDCSDVIKSLDCMFA